MFLTPLALATIGHALLESGHMDTFAADPTAFVPSYYQSAYRLNYRPGVKYILDCETGVGGLEDDQTCIEYCKGNVLEPMYKPDLEAALSSWPNDCKYSLYYEETLDTLQGNVTVTQSDWEMEVVTDGRLLQHSLSWDLASMLSPSVSETGPLAPSFSKITFKVYYAAVGGFADTQGSTAISGTVSISEGVSTAAGTCVPLSLQASDAIQQEVPLGIQGYPIVMDWSTEYFVDLDPSYVPVRNDTGPSLASGQVLFQFEIEGSELFSEWEQARRYMSAVAASNPDSEVPRAIASNTTRQGTLMADQDESNEWDPTNNQAFSICIALRADLNPADGHVMTTGLPWRTLAVMKSVNSYEVVTGADAEILPIESDCPFQCDCRYDLVRNDPWFHGTNGGEVDETVYAKGTRCARDPLACPGELILPTSLAKSIEPTMAFYKPAWRISAEGKPSFF